MNFERALELLQKGNRIISKTDKRIYNQQWLNVNEEGLIFYMNEPWNPDVEWLLECIKDEWINVEEDCDYHVHNESNECIR